MSAPQPDARKLSSSRSRRMGPFALAAVAGLAAVAVWFALQLWLHLMGIATSPLGWLLSGIGALASLISAKG